MLNPVKFPALFLSAALFAFSGAAAADLCIDFAQ